MVQVVIVHMLGCGISVEMPSTRRGPTSSFLCNLVDVSYHDKRSDKNNIVWRDIHNFISLLTLCSSDVKGVLRHAKECDNYIHVSSEN